MYKKGFIRLGGRGAPPLRKENVEEVFLVFDIEGSCCRFIRTKKEPYISQEGFSRLQGRWGRGTPPGRGCHPLRKDNVTPFNAK